LILKNEKNILSKNRNFLLGGYFNFWRLKDVDLKEINQLVKELKQI
jgi:hypothetical protein